MTYGNLTLPEPWGPVQPFTGIALPLPEQKMGVLWAPKSLIQVKLTSYSHGTAMFKEWQKEDCPK